MRWKVCRARPLFRKIAVFNFVIIKIGLSPVGLQIGLLRNVPLILLQVCKSGKGDALGSVLF